MGLTFHGLSIHKGGRLIINRCSGEIPAGKVTVVIGPNGSGKTTLLRTLAGLETDDIAKQPVSALPGQTEHDAIHWQSQSLAKMSKEQRAQWLAWNPARSDLPFPFSVQDIVLMGRFPWHQGSPSCQDRAIADQWIADLGLAALKDRPVTTLSDGERQKTLIARSLAGDHAVILLDEPLANLDIATALLVGQRLKAESKRRTIALSLHDLGLALRLADHVICLNGGKIERTGSAEVIDEPLIHAVFGVKAQRVELPDGSQTLNFYQ